MLQRVFEPQDDCTAVRSIVLQMISNGFLDSLQGFNEYAARAGDINAFEALSLGSKYETFIQVNSRLLEHQV